MKCLKTVLALVALLNVASAFAATCTWTGSVSSAMNGIGNWTGCSVPVNGDSLVFPDSAFSKTVNNNLGSLTSVNSIVINGCGYSMSGIAGFDITSAVPITANCDVTGGANSMSFDMNLTNAGPKEIRQNTVGSMVQEVILDLGSNIKPVRWDNKLTFKQTQTTATQYPSLIITLSETTSGATANEVVIDGGAVYFADANLYAGLTTVKKGQLRIGNAGSLGALGNAANGTVVKTGGILEKQVANIGNEFLTLDDDANAPGVRGPVLTTGVLGGGNWAGPIVLTGVVNGVLPPEAEIAIDNAQALSIGGVISGSADLLITSSMAFGSFTPQVANTYGGSTSVGTNARLMIGAISERLPNTTVVNVLAGGQFWLSAQSPNVTETIAGIAGAGSLRMDNNGTPGQSQLALDLPPGKTFNFSGPINDVSAAGNKLLLNVFGSGTQILAANTTYAGATNVTGSATLDVRGSSNSAAQLGASAILLSDAAASLGAITPIAGAVSARVRPGGVGGFGKLDTVNAGGLVFNANVAPEFDVAGITVGVNYDQLYTEGLTVNVSNAPLVVNFITHLNPGEVVRLIDFNTGPSPIVGTFLSVPQGAYLPPGPGPKYQASYTGGTGNDFTLTRIAPIANVTGAITGVIGQTVSAPALAPTGGVLPYASLSVSGGPAWLSGAQSGNTLVLSGTVGAPAGTQNFTLNVVDAAGQTGTFPLTISVSAGATDFSWNGSVDANWATPGNWTPAGPPTSGAIVRFPASAVTKVVNAIPLGSFDFFELTSFYTLNGVAQVTLTNANPVRFSGTANTSTDVNLPLRLSAANALVSVNVSGNAFPTFLLGGVTQNLDFAGNVNFEFTNTPSGTGRAILAPYFAATAQTGNVSYTRTSGSGHFAVLNNATNYAGTTTITGPGLTVDVRTSAPFGDTGAVTDTTLTDAVINIYNESAVPGNSLVIDHERLITNQAANGNATQLNSQHSIASTVVEWRGPVVATGANVLLRPVGGTLRFNGVISGGADVRIGQGDTGTIVFDGANTFTSRLEINTPTEVLTSANERIPNTAIVAFNGPGTLNLAGNSETVNNINGAGIVKIGNGGVSGRLTIVANTASFFGSLIDAPSGGQFVQTGGTLTFTGTASNTLPTLLQGGTLNLNGGTLPQVRMDGGNLVVSGPATVGDFLPSTGASTGGLLLGSNIMNVGGALGFASGITLTSIIDADGPGRASVTGAATLAGASLNLSPSGTPINVGGSYDLIAASSVTGTFAGKPDNTVINVSGQFYRINYTATKVVITRVAPPAIVTVNTLGDGSSPVVCTLRKAVEAGNNPGVAPLNSSCGAVGANPTIQFDPSFLSIPNATILLSGGEITISKDMTISNIAARTLKIDASNNTRIFRIDDGAASVINVTLEGLNLVNGRASFEAAPSATLGGAIYTRENLNLFGMRFEGNQAQGNLPSGGAVGGAAGTFIALVVQDCLFVGNSVSSSLAGSSVRGGAIYSAPGTVTITNTTFTANSAVVTGAGAATAPNANGGALYINNGTATLDLNSFVGNTTSAANLTSGAVESKAAGLFALASSVQLNSTVFSANRSLSTGSARTGFADVDFAGGSVSAKFSMIADAPASLSQTNAIAGLPLLSPLTNNGGDTDTIGFQSGSVLKNAGDPGLNLPPFDQRGPGFNRNVSGVDVGAYEQVLSVTPIGGALAAGTASTVYSGASVAASGGIAPYSYIASGLPPGLMLNASTGAITGTPTSSVGSPFLVVVTVTDATVPIAQTIVANYSISIAPAPVVINISAAGNSVTEGNAGSASLDFVIFLSAAAAVPVEVIVNTGFSAGALAADDADFTAISNQLVTFAPGETIKIVSVTVLGDNIVEADETLRLLLSNPPMPTATILTASVLGTINNDDSAVINVNAPIIAEGNSGTTPLTFTLSLSKFVQGAVSVNYATSDGTATLANSDYTASSGTAVIPILGQTTISVPIIGDTDVEANEAFNFTLSNVTLPTGITSVTIAGPSFGTILNDDAASPTTVALTTPLPTAVYSAGVSYPVAVQISAAVRPTGTATVTATRLGLPALAPIGCALNLANGNPTSLVGSCNLSPTAPGAWATTVAFTGSGGFANGSFIGNAVYTTALAPLTFSQSVNPTVIGQSFTLNVSAAANGGGPVPAGTVQVTQFPGGIPASAPMVAGVATVNLLSRSPVIKALLVQFVDANGVYTSSAEFIDHTTNPAPTGLTASLSAASGAAGVPVTVTYSLGIVAPGAAVPGLPAASGQVQVSDGVSSANCTVAVPSGSCVLSPTTLGARQITVRYLADAYYQGSTSAALPYIVQQGGGAVDLSVTIGNGVRVINTSQVVYTVVVRNLGDTTVGGATLVNLIPAGALSQSYTCAAAPGSSCGAGSGSGAINQTIDVAATGSVAYRVVVEFPTAGEVSVLNTVTVATPVGVVDGNPANNSATDTDPRGIFGAGFEDEIE